MTLTEHFNNKPQNNLNVYFTAGYPHLDSTITILKALDTAGADLIEIGFPYSDPLADGPTIADAGAIALKNGINIQAIFNQVESVKGQIKAPLIAMGYYNQILQFGVEKFLQNCVKVGISGMIFPDLPLEYYQEHYQSLFEKYGIANIFLITPQTSDERILKLAAASTGFLYIVSSASITGKTGDISEEQKQYFQRIKDLKLSIPTLIGFGISDKKSFDTACEYSNGGIIGSALIKAINPENIEKSVIEFIKKVR